MASSSTSRWISAVTAPDDRRRAASAAVQESKERVRSAIRNSALSYPFNSRVTVNLAPADAA